MRLQGFNAQRRREREKAKLDAKIEQHNKAQIGQIIELSKELEEVRNQENAENRGATPLSATGMKK